MKIQIRMEKNIKKNIIMLMLDTVRADDVNTNSALAMLNYISRNATKYGCAVSPGTWTAPAHAALFTDKKVSQIKHVSQNFLHNGTYKIDPWMVKTKFLSENENTIAKKLSDYGYQSSLLSNNPFLTSYTNLAVGFDMIHDIWKHSNIKYNKGLASKFNGILNSGANGRIAMIYTAYCLTRMLPKSTIDRMYTGLRRSLYNKSSQIDGTYRLDRGANDTNKLLKDYLTYNYNYRPQFMFINYMEAHENYPTNDRKIPQDKWMYLGGIEEMSDYNMKALHRAYLKRLRYLDKSVKKTLNVLKEKGILDNATVVITSDHGQFFGEHGMLFHSLPPYEQVSRVPLLAANYINGKMIKDRDHIEKPVSISSLHQSALDLASGKFDHLDGNLRKDRYVICEHTGISEGWDEKLLKMLAPRTSSAEKILRAKRRHNIKVTAVYNGNLKLMHYFGMKKDELYNVSRDPSESTNIIDSNRNTAHEMARYLN